MVGFKGAYNRTLTPFGFQGEERTFWEATPTYIRLSPFAHAKKIAENKRPLLLIHGENDENSGTHPMQVGAPRGPLHGGFTNSMGVAPRWPLHEGVADLFYTDVRSILMVLWHFKGANG